MRLPTWPQRLLALYTLGFPLIQAATMIYLPISVWFMLFGKLPVLVAMLSSLPVYVLLVQLLISLVGLYEFTAVHKLRLSWRSPLWLIVAFLPFQWMLGFAALRAAWRQLRGMNSWEKTRHIGAHRVGQFAQPAPAVVAIEGEEPAHG
jgi:hypothetical protein